MLCPICNKGTLLPMGPILICCGCEKAWEEHEFLASIQEAGLSYYFTPDIHGTIVVYDPKEETHKFIEL